MLDGFVATNTDNVSIANMSVLAKHKSPFDVDMLDDFVVPAKRSVVSKDHDASVATVPGEVLVTATPVDTNRGSCVVSTDMTSANAISYSSFKRASYADGVFCINSPSISEPHHFSQPCCGSIGPVTEAEHKER
jgi:hypothetical protein